MVVGTKERWPRTESIDMPDSLPSVEASWSTPYSVDNWARMLTLCTPVEMVGPGADDALVLGPALPAGTETRLAEVLAFRDQGAQLIHWMLRVRLPPDEPPPVEVQEADMRFGGREGLTALLLDIGGGPGVSCNYRVHARLMATEWTCAVLPRSADIRGSDAPIGKLGPTANVERIGYRFTGRVDGLQEVDIAYSHVGSAYFAVDFLVIDQLSVGTEKWLPIVDEFLPTTINALFERKEHSP